MKTVALIQARIGSNRLPNKMMLSLNGKPIIDWVIKRVQTSDLLDDIVAAIPLSQENDILEKQIRSHGVKVFRGSENNVLNRFFEAATMFDASHIVRVCADNPLIDGHEIDNLVKFYFNNPCDYAYNHIPEKNLYPNGIGAEIVSFDLLKKLHEIAYIPKHLEHCLSYIWDNSEQFSIKTFDPPDKELHHPEIRLDIDTFDDYYLFSMKEFNFSSTSKEIVKIFGN